MDRSPEQIVFQLILIKPSHYDDNGYVIQWVRSIIPSNSLATLYGLALDCSERRVLGQGVRIELTALDETNTRIEVEKLVGNIRNSGGHGLVGLVGVQSNQFPRAVDIARQFRAANVEVIIGGFHVSGCLAMLPEMTPELQEAMDLGISLFAGEAEGRLESVLQDAYRSEMRPIYNYTKNLPQLEEQPPPYLPAERIARTMGRVTTFDAGRGCPFLCSFCTIINVQGRKSRSRSADNVERILRGNLAQGITNFFITDDNFARNKDWETLFDRMIELREGERLPIKLMIQVDTMCHKIPGFIAKARRAGVNRVFIGLENINPDALSGTRKGQNRITEYRGMLQAWRAVGVTTLAGYILGFPSDTRASVLRDLKTIQRELPIDLLEFFILTPLPGSEDHQKLYQHGVAMDGDMNQYDTVHVVTDHPKMSRSTLRQLYREAWNAYYTLEHVETLLRRAKASSVAPRTMMGKVLKYYSCMRFENVHPLEAGLVRRKYRKDRRPGMTIENPLVFYPRCAWENVKKYGGFAALAWRYYWICRRVERDLSFYTDIALSPIDDSEMADLALFTATDAAKAAFRKTQQKKGRGVLATSES